MDSNTVDLMLMLSEKIQYGEELIDKLKPIENIDGVMKLQRKIKQETEFLKKLQKSKKVKIEQLCCSNLRHLGAMVECALRPGVVAVCKIFHIDEDSKMVVDVICDEGKTWTKVIARNPRSLSALSSGNASYGARSILDQAEDYLRCAKLYPCMYQPPKVLFEFVSGIEETLANKLKAIGVLLKGEILPDSNICGNDTEDDDDDSRDSDEETCIDTNDQKCLQDVSHCIEEHSEIDTLNLDVTAMMAYVSNMTNGHCNYVFKQDVLTQQSTWESERPVKPILERLFEDKCGIYRLTIGKAYQPPKPYEPMGKKIVCCETAWNDFEKIVHLLGGEQEIQRTAQLKSRLTVLPDCSGGKDDYPRRNLKVRGNVRLRSKLIFNFGHRIKALTVSANEGFVRAAAQQGVSYAAFIHESRALTEGKEATATKIVS